MTAKARLSCLARILLTSRQSLARHAVALFVVSQISACVLPIAPEFQDPPASANYAPRIINTIPPQGSIVTGSITGISPFTATVTDPNLGDSLYVRWLADYPPQGPNTRTLVPDTKMGNSPTGQDVAAAVSCTNVQLAPITEHQITVIVADRPFSTSPTDDKTALMDPVGFTVQANWILKLDCTVAP